MDKNFYIKLGDFSPLYLDRCYMLDWLSYNLNTLIDNTDFDIEIMYDGYFCGIVYYDTEKCYCLKSHVVGDIHIKLN